MLRKICLYILCLLLLAPQFSFARTIYVGAQNKPIWGIDFTKEQTSCNFGQGTLTNTRATERTVVKDGAVGTVATTTPAFGDNGLSVEPAATNLLARSQEFDNAAWAKGSQVAIAPDAAAAPDGATTADKYAIGDLINVNLAQANQSPADPAGKTFSFSIWVQAIGEAASVGLFHQGVTLGVVASQYYSVPFDGQWHRISLTHTFGSTSDSNHKAGVRITTGSIGDRLYLWGAQLEEGPVATAYIPTVASTVSRAADANGFTTPQAVKNLLSTAEGPATAAGTLVVRDWTPGFSASDLGGSVLYRPVVAVADLTYGLLFYQGSGGAPEIRTHDGSAGQGVALSWAAGVSYDLAVRWSASTGVKQVGYKLSSAPTWTWGAAGAFDGAFTLDTTLWLGYSPSYPFQIGRPLIYDRWLSDSQLAFMDSIREWVAMADDYYPARAVNYGG